MPSWWPSPSTCSSGIRSFLLCLALLALLILTPFAESTVWGDGVKGDLSWGEILEMENYTLKVADFSALEGQVPRVLVDIYEIGEHKASRVLSPGEDFCWNDSLRVSMGRIQVESLTENESRAEVGMQIPARSEISVVLIPDKEIYDGGEEASLEVRVKNAGLVDAEDLKLSLQSEGLQNAPRFGRGHLGPGEVWKEENVKFKAPFLPQPEEVAVWAKVSFSNSEGIRQEARGSASFRVGGPIQIHKRVEDVQQFGEHYYAITTIRNTGNISLDVDLEDAAGEHFAVDSPLSKSLHLHPGSTEIVSHTITAKHPGMNLVVPAAKASYILEGRTHEARSESPVVDVIGPYLEVKRALLPEEVSEGKDVEISTKVSNSGNRFAGVYIREELPPFAKLIKGNLSHTFILRPGEGRDLTCKVECPKAGEFEIAGLNVSYRDADGNMFYSASLPLKLLVRGKSPHRKEINASLTSKGIENTLKRPEKRPINLDNMPLPALLITALLALLLSRYL